MAQLQVRDTAGAGLPDINIRIAEGSGSSEQAIYDVYTDDGGNSSWSIPYWPEAAYTLHVNVVDVNAAYGSAVVPVSTVGGAQDVVIVLEKTGGSFLSSVFAHDDQYLFATDDGKPWAFAGYSMHLLISAIHTGQDVTGVLQETVDYGANVIVTIGTHLSPWKQEHGFYVDPLADVDRYQRELAQMFDLAASYNLRVAHAVLADCQYKYGVSDQRRIWDVNCEVMKGRWNVLGRIGNECYSNGYWPDDFSFPDLGGVLASYGSVGIDIEPWLTYKDWHEWEPPRDPYPKAIADSGSGILQQYTGYTNSDGLDVGPYRCPVVAIEMPFFNDTNPDQYGDERWTDPAQALQLGTHCAASCAGGATGTSNGLEAKPNGAVAAECMRQFFKGFWQGWQR